MRRADKQRYLNNRRYVCGDRDLWFTNNEGVYESIKDAVYEAGPRGEILYVYTYKGELLYALDVTGAVQDAKYVVDDTWIVEIGETKLQDEWPKLLVRVCEELEEQADAQVPVRKHQQLAG